MRGLKRAGDRGALPMIALLLWVYSGTGICLDWQAVQLPMPYPSQGPAAAIPPELIPSPQPLEGVYAPNTYLRQAARLFDGQIARPESVAVGNAGSLLMPDEFGAIWQADPGENGQLKLASEPLAHVGSGRPLGIRMDHDGNIILCNAATGLQMVEKDSHQVLLLASHAYRSDEPEAAVPLRFANSLDIASDGTIYFTDSQAFGPLINHRTGVYEVLPSTILGILQGSPEGKLLAYSPTTRRASILSEGILFANGVALSHAGDFVAVVETGSWRVLRHWLTGPKKGTRDVLTDSLPGSPDGISRSKDGEGFWISIVIPKTPLISIMPYRWLRFMLAWLPQWLLPPLDHWGCLVQVSESGQVLRMLMDPDGFQIAGIAAIAETADHIYMASLTEKYVGVFDKASLPPVMTARPASAA